MKLLIFDIDGTLTHLDGATRRAFDVAFRAVFSVPAQIAGIPMHGRTDPAIFRDCYRQTGLSGEWTSAYDEFCPAYLTALPPSIEQSAGKRLLPGVEAILEALSSRKSAVGLALGTGNMEAGARLKIGYFGLNHYFPVGGFGDGHEQRSDLIRDAWRKSESHFRQSFAPGDVWVIGDTCHDVEGGKSNGFQTLAVATGGAFTVDQLIAAEADVVLPDLADTQAVLRAIQVD